MKNTKIIATLSKQVSNKTSLQKFIKLGVDAFRLNTAHLTIKEATDIIQNIKTHTKNIPIIIDTKGPQLRIFVKKEFSIKRAEKIIISDKKTIKKEITQNKIYVNYEKFVEKTSINDHILIEDGTIELIVKKKLSNNELECISKNNAIIKNNKNLTVKNKTYPLTSLTKKDKEFIKLSILKKVEFIAHSFVRNKKDLEELKKEISRYQTSKNKHIPKIISKIENIDGIKNIDEILDNSYGLMVARGDLGIEISYDEIPIIQKKIINKCIEKKKLVIVATQILHSMIENKYPTRAEINDIANNIFDGCDALMLSGETAHGKYPFESIKIMNKTINTTENNKTNLKYNKTIKKEIQNPILNFITESVILASNSINICAILTDTLTGRTARYLSSLRLNIPIHVQCYNDQIKQELNLNYAIIPMCLKKRNNNDYFLKELILELLNAKKLKKTDLVLVVGGSFKSTLSSSFLEIAKVKEIIELFS